MKTRSQHFLSCGALIASVVIAPQGVALSAPSLVSEITSKKSSSISSSKGASQSMSKDASYGATEPAFFNKYWNKKEDGIYVDAETGEALFSSKDKFDSGTGWPSFTKPLKGSDLMKRQDSSHGMERVEVATAHGRHLGHVFNDGPKEAGGNRYCVNSYTLRFVPKEELLAQGYGEYLSEFE